MSLTGGYDVVIEISEETFRRMIISEGKISGVPLVPEFELPPIAGAQHNAHIIIKDIHVDLQPSTNLTLMTLRLDFHRSTISFSGRDITHLAGTITLINVPLDLDNIQSASTWSLRALHIRLSNPRDGVSISFDAASLKRIREGISGLISESEFLNQLNSNLSSYLKTAIKADPKFPSNGYLVQPEVDGVLVNPNPSAKGFLFEQLDKVFCRQESVGLFGGLLVKNHRHNNEDPHTWVPTAFEPDQDLAISISAEVFRRDIFCPSVVKSLQTPQLDNIDTTLLIGYAQVVMPTCCGAQSSIPMIKDGEKINFVRVCDSFADGHINVEMDFNSSGFCYTATGEFRAQMVLDVQEGRIVSTFRQSRLTMKVSVDFWCNAAVAFVTYVAPALGGAIIAIIRAVLPSETQKAAEEAAQALSSTPLGSASLGSTGMTPVDVRIEPEGLKILGRMDLRIPKPKTPGFRLEGSTVPNGPKVPIGAGVYQFPGTIWCSPDEFEFVAYQQPMKAMFTAVPTLLATPLRIEWTLFSPFVDTQNQVVILADSSGTVTLRLTVSFPFLPHVPTIVPNHAVTLSYAIAKDPVTGFETITLTGNPAEGNYLFGLRAQAFEPSLGGPILGDVPRPVATVVTGIEFAGLSVEFEPAFYAHMNECKIAEDNFFGRFAEPSSPFPIPIPGDPLTPDWVQDLLRRVAAMNSQDAVATIIMERLRRGQEFDRLFSSSELSNLAVRLLPAFLTPQ